MQIDSMVGIGIFLVFAAWSFQFYSAQFQAPAGPLGEMADTIHGKVLEYLEMEVYSVPVRFNSPDSASAVLYLTYSWPEGSRDSTRIKQAGESLACELMDDYVYWEADLAAGNNYFTLETANSSTDRNCQASLNKSITNHTLVYAGERVRMLSQSRINSMVSLDYQDFRAALGVTGADFRLEIVNSTGTTAYGLTVPGNRDVYVPVSSNKIWDSDEEVNITVSVW